MFPLLLFTQVSFGLCKRERGRRGSGKRKKKKREREEEEEEKIEPTLTFFSVCRYSPLFFAKRCVSLLSVSLFSQVLLLFSLRA